MVLVGACKLKHLSHTCMEHPHQFTGYQTWLLSRQTTGMNVFPHTLPSIQSWRQGRTRHLKQRQALERLWLIPSPFVTIFKNSWLVSTKQHFQDTKVSFMTAICSSLLQLPEGLSRMSVTEGQVHSWDPTPGQSSRNRTKPWVKTQTLCLDTSTKCLPNSSALHSVTQTHRGWLLPSEVYSLTAIAQPTYRDMKGFTEVTKGVSGRRRHQMWAAAVSLSSACPLNFAVC